MLLMGKSTISMVIFHSFLYVYQRVNLTQKNHPIIQPCGGHFTSSTLHRDHGGIPNFSPNAILTYETARRSWSSCLKTMWRRPVFVENDWGKAVGDLGIFESE